MALILSQVTIQNLNLVSSGVPSTDQEDFGRESYNVKARRCYNVCLLLKSREFSSPKKLRQKTVRNPQKITIRPRFRDRRFCDKLVLC